MRVEHPNKALNLQKMLFKDLKSTCLKRAINQLIVRAIFYTLMVQIKFTTNKVDVLQKGTFFRGWGGKKIENF